MSENNTIVMTTGTGQEAQFDISQLTDLAMENIPEFRGARAPAGLYDWRIERCEMTTREMNDGAGGRVYRAVIVVGLHATNCISLVDRTLNPAEYVDQEHVEGITIFRQQDMGRLVAMMIDSGFTVPATNMLEAMTLYVGHEFRAPIKQNPDKNDPDKIYSNLVFEKIVPIEAGSAENMQAKMAEPAAAPPPAVTPGTSASATLAGLPGAAA